MVTKGVTPAVWRSVKALGVPGVTSEVASQRTYPAGAVAGNLIGWVGADGTPRAGLEVEEDAVLQGRDGTERYERGRDGQRIPMAAATRTDPVDGADVRLTIDRDLQWYAQQAISAQVDATGAEWGAVTVMDPTTFAVLALAESGAVDPNDPGATPPEMSGNRSLQDVFEPGSTAKVVTAAAALEEGVTTPGEKLRIPYTYTVPNGQVIQDSHPHALEDLTFAGVLGESSNTGTVMVGSRLGDDVRYDYQRRFGFGQKTALDFPGESAGLLHAPGSKGYDGRTRYTTMFGQGLSTTMVQSAQVFATLANGGVREPTHVVAGTRGADGRFVPTPLGPPVRVVSERTAKQVVSMLEGAVGEGGTGEAATVPGYRVAGKTGTAQIAGEGGYAGNGFIGSFNGMAPAEDPQLVVAVSVARPTKAGVLRRHGGRPGLRRRDGLRPGRAAGAPQPQRPRPGAADVVSAPPAGPARRSTPAPRARRAGEQGRADGNLAPVVEGTSGLAHRPLPTLDEVAAHLGRHLVGASGPVGRTGAAGAGPGSSGRATVRRAVLDSRRVRPGDLYAALPGATTHGALFAAGAVADGAVAVLTDPRGASLAGDGDLGVPVLVVDEPRARLGPLAAWLAGEPATRMTMLGVTGTNGKTTVTALVEGALSACGVRAGLIGTTGTRVAGVAEPGARTTPEAPDLQETLARMVDAGVAACAMEVSSHAAVMHRVDGVVLDVLAFTHLTRDHLDLHGSMEAYFEAKASLFTPSRARAAVVLVDDAWGRRLAGLCRRRGVPLTTVSAAAEPDPGADVRVVAGSVRQGSGGSCFELEGAAGAGGRTSTGTTLPGSFNVANAALAHTVLHVAGLGAAAAALPGVAGPPGRMQRVAVAPGGPSGVVDYAHTPDAVAAALAALRGATAGDLVVVLGAGGDRDRGKRAAMGAAAATGADVVVVTDDNPRTEDPAAIRAAVLAGARGAGSRAEVVEVAGRGAAVGAAVARAARRSGSTVLLAGKGHESGQEVDGVVTPFDDASVLAAAVAAAAPAPAGRAVPARATT